MSARSWNAEVNGAFPPPPGQSPTLAAWRLGASEVRRDRWPALVVLVIWFGLVALLRRTDAVGWLLFLGGAVLAWVIVDTGRRREGVWVGKDWLCVPWTRGSRWVRTDALTVLKLDWHGDLAIHDHEGRKLRIRLELLRRDPEVLRIFVAAARGSIAKGLQPNRDALEELGLDPADRDAGKPPA
jgi:hypothetical protein